MLLHRVYYRVWCLFDEYLTTDTLKSLGIHYTTPVTLRDLIRSRVSKVRMHPSELNRTRKA